MNPKIRGYGRGQVSNRNYARRYHLVESGKASWLKKFYTLDEAIERAGL